MSDRGDYYSEHVVRGRKAYAYACGWCRREIARGEQHVMISASSAGTRWSKRAHLVCHEAAVERAPLAVVEASR